MGGRKPPPVAPKLRLLDTPTCSCPSDLSLGLRRDWSPTSNTPMPAFRTSGGGMKRELLTMCRVPLVSSWRPLGSPPSAGWDLETGGAPQEEEQREAASERAPGSAFTSGSALHPGHREPPSDPPGMAAAPPSRWWLGAAFLLGALWPGRAIHVYTYGSLEVLNGTDVRLKCTFSSQSPVGLLTTVSWEFQPERESRHEFVFYYSDRPHLPQRGRFVGRVTWDGNIASSDGSIKIYDVQPTDNGTFYCSVKNPPDVDGLIGETQLKVVMKVILSEIHILLLSIGSASALMILIVVVVFVCRHRRAARRQEKAMEMVETELMEKEKLRKAEEEPPPLPREGA